ncbi:hypothetical protein [Euzebya rosea]|uniref:hypothetical protein n=1 Tax=Euzebya rosea TaxID=2052804 RepID=UPI000D3E0E31|nr:hypothetical protein [Euzebya rosea]
MSRLRTTRRRTVAIALALAIGVPVLLGAADRLRGPGDAPVDAVVRTATVQLVLPATLVAGDTHDVAVTADVEGEVPMVVATSAGSSLVLVDVDAGHGTLRLGPPLTEAAGTLTVDVLGDRPLRRRTEVVPGPPVGLVEPLVGPRSIVVEQQRTMVVAVPLDRYGNAVPADTPVAIAVERPDGRVQRWTEPTDGMLAWSWVPAGTVAGSARISVAAEEATGPDVRYREVPDVPVEVVVSADRSTAQVDGTRTVVVETGLLEDRHGNVLTDGVSARVTVDSATGRSVLDAAVVGGRVRLPIPVEGVGALSVVVSVQGVDSAPLALDATDAAVRLPVVRTDDTVVVGPVLDALGARLPDGTDVVVELDTGASIDAQLIGGVAIVALPAGADGVAVTVSGTTVTP